MHTDNTYEWRSECKTQVYPANTHSGSKNEFEIPEGRVPSVAAMPGTMLIKNDDKAAKAIASHGNQVSIMYMKADAHDEILKTHDIQLMSRTGKIHVKAK